MKKIALAIIIGVLLAFSTVSIVAFAGTIHTPHYKGTRTIGNSYSEDYTYYASDSTRMFKNLVSYGSHTAKTRVDLYPNIVGYSGFYMRAYVKLYNTRGTTTDWAEDVQIYKNNSNWAVEANESNSIFYNTPKAVHEGSISESIGTVADYEFFVSITAVK